MSKEQEITGTIKNKINNISSFFNHGQLKASGKSRLGWFCTYTPEELIIAGGFIPYRIFGRKKISRSESYFPINFCPYIKSGWESLLDNTAGLEGLVFTSSCDGMRRLYDTACKYLKDIPSYLLDVPHITGEDSLKFFASCVNDMKIFIEKISGKKITALEIEKSIIAVNRKRELLKELNNFYKKFPGILDITTYYEILELALVSEPEIFIDKLKKYLIFIKEITARNRQYVQPDYKDYPSVMIIGNFIAEKKLWQILSSMSLNLAFDDLCTSSRYFEKQIEPGKDKDFMVQIARRYLNKPGCMRMASLGLKLSEIENNIIKNDIKGVMFISLKFCDTMLYSFPVLKKKLTGMGIPVLYLELEYNNFSEGQAKTRIQAFLEML